MSEHALSDLKIVELASFVSGPYCTKLLADLGAEVVKVEEPGDGDCTRRLGPFPNDIPDHEKSGQFLYLNMNKFGITLNIRTAVGRKIFKELINQSDALIEDHPRLMMKELGLDYESLRKVNSRLVMTSITPFGHTGPYKDYKAYDINITAGGGMNCRLGFSDREPLSMPAMQGSYYSGLHAAAATLMAIYARDRGGPGQHVDISQVRTWAISVQNEPGRFISDKWVTTRSGHELINAFPSGVFNIKDGQVFLMAGEARRWESLLQAMGNPKWGEDPRFTTPESRYQYRDELKELMKPWLESLTKEKVEKLRKEDRNMVAACTVLNSIEDAVNDEQYQEREFFVEFDQPEVGRLKYPGPPYKFAKTPWSLSRSAPQLGQHNNYIYCDQLGYSKDDLVDLRRAKVI